MVIYFSVYVKMMSTSHWCTTIHRQRWNMAILRRSFSQNGYKMSYEVMSSVNIWSHEFCQYESNTRFHCLLVWWKMDEVGRYPNVNVSHKIHRVINPFELDYVAFPIPTEKCLHFLVSKCKCLSSFLLGYPPAIKHSNGMQWKIHENSPCDHYWFSQLWTHN